MSRAKKKPICAQRATNPPIANPPDDSQLAEELDAAHLTGTFMYQAIRAAILLISEQEQPEIAADVLRLARDRYELEERPNCWKPSSQVEARS